MVFKVESNGGTIVGSISECITFMKEQEVMQAVMVEETGLNFAMMILGNEESLTLDDRDSNEIKVTRIQ